MQVIYAILIFKTIQTQLKLMGLPMKVPTQHYQTLRIQSLSPDDIFGMILRHGYKVLSVGYPYGNRRNTNTLKMPVCKEWNFIQN